MNIEEMKQAIIATNAYYATSWDPEKRIAREADNFEKTVCWINELCGSYGVDPERFIEKRFNLLLKYLNSESRCMSAAVVGFSKFPAARNEKRTNWAHNHLTRIVQFDETLEKKLKRITRPRLSQTEKSDVWEKKIEALKSLQELMKKCNKLIRSGKKAEAEQMAGFKFVPDYAGRIGFPDYKLRNNLANIKRLEKQIEDVKRMTTKPKEEMSFDFNGGRVEYDADEIRFNIFFDEVPEVEKRSKLKSHGFKWSPRRSAWTRGAKTMPISFLKKILA